MLLLYVAVVRTVLMDQTMGRTAQCRRHITRQILALVQITNTPGAIDLVLQARRVVNLRMNVLNRVVVVARTGVRSDWGVNAIVRSDRTNEVVEMGRAKEANQARNRSGELTANVVRRGEARGRAVEDTVKEMLNV